MLANKPRVVGAILVCLLTAIASGRLIARPAGPAAAGNVNLPYNVSDSSGNQWMFYQSGQFQQSGNMPVYGQGAMLQVNGANPQSRNNQARLDDKSGEVIFENMTANNVTVTRRILFNREEGWVRYVDIIKNTQKQDASVALVWSTNTNYGVQSASTVADPKRKDQNLAWVAQTHANGRCVVEMFGGKAAKMVPTIQYNPGNSNVQVNFSPTIPAGKEIAVMHFHLIVNTVDQGQKFVLGMKESKVMASLPSAIRKLIVNFRGGENFVGDYEILRGDLLDVVELRSGDQLKGTLKEKSFKLQTFYGTIEMPVEKVVGLINAGEYRPRQLMVTVDGEIFGGRLDRDKLALELSSGQVTEIPISQIARMGYRKRSGEAEEWNFEKPVVLMRTGDRICIQAPTREFDAATRYGSLKLKPQLIGAIDFQAEDHGVHQITLADGSRFAGLVLGDTFEMKLAGEGPEQIVKFPVSAIRRLQLAGKIDEGDDEQGTLELANEDSLVGGLVGALKLDTAFNTLTISAGEIKRLVHTPTSPTDVQMVLWDESIVSGQLQEQELTCRLKSGLEMKVPVTLVQEYSQPRPQPSTTVLDSIKVLIGELNAEDWKQRDAAQERLTMMGSVVISTLNQMKAAQTPEAQQRIEAILKQLEKNAPKDKPKASSTGAPVAPPMQIIIDE